MFIMIKKITLFCDYLLSFKEIHSSKFVYLSSDDFIFVNEFYIRSNCLYELECEINDLSSLVRDKHS